MELWWAETGQATSGRSMRDSSGRFMCEAGPQQATPSSVIYAPSLAMPSTDPNVVLTARVKAGNKKKQARGANCQLGFSDLPRRGLDRHMLRKLRRRFSARIAGKLC